MGLAIFVRYNWVKLCTKMNNLTSKSVRYNRVFFCNRVSICQFALNIIVINFSFSLGLVSHFMTTYLLDWLSVTVTHSFITTLLQPQNRLKSNWRLPKNIGYRIIVLTSRQFEDYTEKVSIFIRRKLANF